MEKPNRTAPGIPKKASESAPGPVPGQLATSAVLSGDPAILYPVGIRTKALKYLTVESFGDQLNASGVSLRSKQVFVIETDGNGHFAFKSHKGKYIVSDHKEVKADSATKTANIWHTIQFYDGVVTIQNPSGKYLSADDAGKCSVSATVGENELFDIHINYHPQICLITQKRYLAVKGTEVVSNRDNQFGFDTLLTREEGEQRGHYALRASSGKYISVVNEKVVANSVDMRDPTSQFTFEFHGNNLAIKCIGSGKYLTAQGTGLSATRAHVTLKEIFKLVDSDAQVTIKANNGKYVSFQGVNLMTTNTVVKTEDIFLLENIGNKWAFKSVQEVYFSIKSDGSIAADAKNKTDTELFTLEFNGPKVSFKACTGKYLSAKPLGGVEAKSNQVGPNETFEIFFYNRPQIVLQTNQQSFVGTTDDKVRTNKAKPESFILEFNAGCYAFRHPVTGKYLKQGSVESRIVLGDGPEWFFFEFFTGKLAIKTAQGKYLKSENQGWWVATADNIGETEMYEY